MHPNSTYKRDYHIVLLSTQTYYLQQNHGLHALPNTLLTIQSRKCQNNMFEKTVRDAFPLLQILELECYVFQ